MNQNNVPRLDLSPRLKRTLSLWNPLDYLRLLYWVFFFPQAIRWYVEQFGNPKYSYKKGSGTWKKFREALREDPIISRLLVQAFALMCIPAVSISWGLSAVGVPINWSSVISGMAGGVGIGVFIGVLFVADEDVAGGITSFVAIGVAGVVALCIIFSVGSGMTQGVVAGIALGSAIGTVSGSAGGVPIGLARVFVFYVGLGFVGGFHFYIKAEATGIDAISIAFIITVFLFLLRLLDYMLSSILSLFTFNPNHRFRFPLMGRLVYLPLPGLQKRLAEWLHQDWTVGVYNANQFLAFSLQYTPLIKAVNTVMSQSPPDTLLKKVSILADRPYDWKLLQFGSADLNKTIEKESILSILGPLLLFKKFKNKIKLAADIRIDTFPRAACAGFWYWHKREAAQAVEAFARVREIAHGEELYNSALALQKGLEISDSLHIFSWEEETHWLDTLKEPGLRPGTIKALRILRSAAGEARTALRSHSLLHRSTAVNRAVDSLSNLVETGGQDCPEPEWPLVQDIARKWLDLFQTLGGQVGKEVLRTPIRNPYIGFSGLPISDESFAGREDILRKIETRWAEDTPLPALFLYGHRRMGKTSILKNLEKTASPSSIYVYLNMQDTTLITHTSQFFLDMANALNTAAQKIGPDVCTPPQKQDYTDLGTARQALNSLLNSIRDRITPPQRIILALDEFEYIEKGINEKKIDPGLLDYLRAINQDYPWLGLIFAGLHTLDEMGRDYRAAFFGQAEALRVSFLTYDETLRLITQPHPDFALEYDDSLIDEIYRLTHGQPYLVQRICWELVNRWNDRFLKEGENTPRTLVLEDLPPILTADFFQAADYYFSGVWSNITKPEQTLLGIMSRGENTLRIRKELAAAAHQDESVEKAIELLLCHDVIVEDEKGLRFASELMRRWVEENTSNDHHLAH